jgi:hypothetical protein
VVTTKKDWQTFCHRVLACAPEAVGPADGFMVLVNTRFGVIRRVLGGGEIAPIPDAVPKACECLCQACSPVGIWPHEAAFSALSRIHWSANENDITHGLEAFSCRSLA